MKYLNRKFRKDFLQLWPQFISVLVMAALSVAIYCGMSSVWSGMNQSYSEYKEKTNLADAYIAGMRIEEADIERIKELDYISDAEASMLLKYDVDIDKIESDIYVTSFNKNTKSVLNPLVVKGKGLNPDDDGIWIDADYAKAHDLKIGDRILIKYNGIEKRVKILGTVLHAENAYFVTSYSETVPDHTAHGYAYMNEKYIKKIMGAISYNQVRLDLSDNSVSKVKMQEDIMGIMGESFSSFAMMKDKTSVVQVENEIKQIKKMALLFSVVFVLLSILSIYTTMSRLIGNQMVEIGTLKSLGFYDRQIYLHYGMYGFLVALLGSILGMILGLNLVANMVLDIKKATLTLPVWKKVVGADSLLLLFLMIFICTFAAIVTTKKAIRNNPSLTIRGIMESKSDISKKQKRRKLPYDVIWTMRSMKMHPGRTAMSIIAVIGSTVLMVAGLGVWDSLNNSYEQVYKEEFRYEYVGQLAPVSYAEISETFDSYNVQFSRVESVDFEYNGKEMEGVLSILNSGDMIRLADDVSGDEINLEEEEAVIAAQLANKLSVGVGGTIEYKTLDSPKAQKVVISAVADAKMPQGIFLHKDKVNDFIPNTIYIGDINAYNKAQDEKRVGNIMSIKEQKDNMHEMMDSVHSITYILILASFVLSAVILYNLGVLSCLERYREYATMKVIGFLNREIKALILKESIFNLLIGLAVGIPLSLRFLELYIGVVSMKSMEWEPQITTGHFITVIGAVIAFSMLVNLIVLAKIRKIDMVESLKSVE